MHILVTGATGLVGTELCRQLATEGHNLTILCRNVEGAKLKLSHQPARYISWPDVTKEPPKEAFDGIDGIINLMGHPILGRWTEEHEKKCRDSRIIGTQSLAAAANRYRDTPFKVFVSASAIGYYSNQSGPYVESSPCGHHTLANICKEWEEAAKALESEQTTIVRIGLVLDRNTEIIKSQGTMAHFFSMPIFGSGEQKMCWIHLQDLIKLIIKSIEPSEKKLLILNAVAPQALSQRALAAAFGKVMRKRLIPIKIPERPMRLVMGKGADLLFLGSHIKSEKIPDSFFRYPDIESALREALNIVTEEVAGKITQCHRLYQAQFLPLSPEQVWEFFKNPKNLEEITPKFLQFKIEAPTDAEVYKGMKIRYKLKLHGIPIRWESLIQDYQQHKEFTDQQVKGPYAVWHHVHRFKKVPGGTLMEDRVFYKLPFGKLGLLALPFVKKDVKMIFAYRRKIIENKFGAGNDQKSLQV